MLKSIQILLVILAQGLLSGCVFQPAMSQGNLLNQEDIDQVEIDMTKPQVRFLLGTPMIEDPFHEDRWDYVYYLKIGRQDATYKRWISIQFADDRVESIRQDQELGPNL